MTENLSLGKKGKSGEIDFSKIKSGIKKKELLEGVDPKLKSVFEQIINKIDKNPDDNMLSREELQAFYKELEDLSKGDGNLSSKEARKYQLSGENIGKKGKDALFAVINKLSELSKDVEEITHETINGQEVEVIKYKDKKTIERVFPDGSRIITVTNGNKTISTTKDKNDKRIKESVTTGTETVTTSYDEDGETKTKEVYTNSQNNDRTTILYENNEPVKRTVEKKGNVENYSITKINGKDAWQLNDKTETVDGVQQKTVYEYDENGNKISETIITSGKTIKRSFSGDNIVEHIKEDGQAEHTRKYDSEGNYTDVYMDENAEVTDSYDSENTHLGQTKVIDGQTYNVKYDKDGNTVGIIVQNGESIQAIADKFGVSVQDLIKVNASKVHGKYPNAYFNVGEEIKIPRKMKADETVLQGRKDRDAAISDYTTAMERRAEEARKKEHEAKLNERTVIVKGGNGYYAAKDGYGNIHFHDPKGNEISEEEFKKRCPNIHANLVKEQNKQNQQVITRSEDGYYITVDGNGDLHYFNPNNDEISGVQFKEKCPTLYKDINTQYGKEIELTESEKQVQKNSAKQIVDELIDAASGWNDVDKIKRAIAKIDTPEELAEVNRFLEEKGYKATDLHSPIEVFIRKEENHGIIRTNHSSDYLEQTVQKWIDNGTLKGQAAIDAQARMAARVIFDGGDGFGTDCEKIKKGVRYIKCPKPTGDTARDNAQAKAVYEKVNEILVKHRTFYGLGSPCKNLRDYCEGEMWESECRYLDGILAENNAIQGEQKAQAIHDLTEEAVAGAGTDIEYLTQAIKAINSREDRIAVEAKLKEYCEKHNVKPKYEGQSYLQAILYDECDTFMGISRDHKEIRKFNEMLIAQGAYKEQEIINLRAEQAALQILEGDFANIKDAVQQIKDPKVYERMLQIFEKISGKSLADFFVQKLGQEKADFVNAELAANNIIDGEDAAKIAYNLILNSDFDKQAMGFKAIRNEEVATMVDNMLKQKGSSLAETLEKFNKAKAEYKEKAKFWDGLGKFILSPVVAEVISDNYKENTDISDNMYVEAKNAQQLTDAQKKAYEMTIRIFEEKLEKMKEDYQKALDSQGVVSGAINSFCEAYGLGTTREEIEARIEHDTETLRLLKLAAEGKLAKVENGKTVAVSFETVFKERNIDTDFDAAKVEKVAKQAETMVAMGYAKENIAICWDELSNAKTAQELTTAIYDTLEKISSLTGQTLTLDAYNYTLKDGVIVDASGKPVPAAELQKIANQLKQGLADIAKDLLGVDVPLNTSSSKISDILSDGYNSKLENFKQEFKDAFGQDVPDEMLEDYMSTISTGMTVLNLGVMLGAIVAAPFTGGGSLAVFTIAATASFGLNALENSTDADGYTNSEWTSDAAQALWDGALAAIGFKVGQFAESFARGSQIVSNQNKWISWLAKQPKGSMTSKLASIPRNQLGKVASKAKEISNKIQAYSGKIGKNVLEAKKASILAKNPGVNLNSVERASVLFARAEACGLEITSDTIQSLVQTYCMAGEFDEESFLTALIMSLAANAVGHGVAAKQMDSTPPSAPRDKSTGTETLDVASSRGAAHPADVQVGAKKAETIKSEVENALQNPNITGEELARIRKEVEALSDRNLRRELLEKIDAKAKSLEAPKQEAFNNARTKDLEYNVNHIFEKHSELNATDVRVLNEYINSTDDINVLNELKDKLKQKELTYGGVTDNYRTLYKSIDDRIKVLTPKPQMSNKEIRSYIYSMLNSDKGMVKEEVEQLLDYIKGVQSADELKELSALVSKKKMIGTYKNQLRAAIEERSNALRTADSAPKTDETPKKEEPSGTRETEEAKAENTQKTEEAPKSNNTGSETTQKTYSEMNQDELFAEYHRLKMEITYAPISNADKAANINKMKEISALLEQKGFRIEGDRLVKINNEAPKTEVPKSDKAAQNSAEAEVPKSKFSAAELRQKLGKKLYKVYQKAENMIKNVRTLVDYNRAKTYIQAQFHKAKDVMNDLLDRLEAKAKAIGLKIKETAGKAVDNVHNAARNSGRPEWLNSFGKNADIKCQANTPVKIDLNTHIRLGDHVDIHLKDLEGKLNAMRDGDSFIIGRNVTGVNDIQINNPYVSGQHIKIEKRNGQIYITDLSSTNGTYLNTTKPDYAAKWEPDISGKYNNTKFWEFNNICDKYYDEIRSAKYSYEDSVNSNISDADLDPAIVKHKYVTTYPGNGWSWRKPNKIRDININVVDRISLNVKADKNMLKELDRLLETGEYINKQGQKVKIKVPDAYYKTPPRLNEWGDRHDPITMYFSEKVSKELEQAIADITEKYARKPVNGKALMNAAEGKPWVAHEAYTSVEEAKALYEEAMKLNPELAEGISSWVGKDDGWNCSSGQFAAAKRMVEEYKLSLSNSGSSGFHRAENSAGNSSRGASNANDAGRASQRADGAHNSSQNTGSAGRTDSASRGRTNSRNYVFNNINDLRSQMKEVLDRFSINTQNKIISDLQNRGSCRLQKNGVEYQFVRRGNNVKLEEFDIRAKYNIKESKIDDYTTHTTYDTNNTDDIWWAMSGKLPRFSPETQSYIINKLSNGETCHLRKGGISYEFSMDANGRITVKEHDYVRYNYDHGGNNNDYNNNRSENASGQRRSEGSSGSNRSQRANNNRMADIQKQERIQTLEAIIERADDINKFRTKFANILSSDFKVADEASIQELKKTTRFIKAFWHTDVGAGAPSDLQVICDELFNMTNGKYVVRGQARMGTPAEVNAMLNKLRELTDINALKKELAELKG